MTQPINPPGPPISGQEFPSTAVSKGERGISTGDMIFNAATVFSLVLTDCQTLPFLYWGFSQKCILLVPQKIGEMFCVRINLYGIVFFLPKRRQELGFQSWMHECKKTQDKVISGSKVHNRTLHVVTIL